MWDNIQHNGNNRQCKVIQWEQASDFSYYFQRVSIHFGHNNIFKNRYKASAGGFVKECYHKSGFCYFVYMILNNVFNSTPCKGLASDIYLYDILYVYEDPNLHIMYFCDVLNYLYVMRVWAYSAFLHIRNNSKTPKDLKVFQDKWFVYFSG